MNETGANDSQPERTGTNGSGSSTHRSPVLRGIRDALVLPAWIVGFSLLGVGSLAQDVGFPFGVAVLSTLLMWAAPAQVILFGGVAGGTALPLLAVAVSLSSIRLLPMTVAMMPMLRRPGQSLLTQLFVAHYVAVTVWIESNRRMPTMPEEERFRYYLGFANACLLVATTMTGIGFLLSAAVPLYLAAGLLFLTPLFFTIALIAGARTLIDQAALFIGAVLAPLFTLLVGPDFDLLATGLVGGTLAWLIGRRRR
ncbi:MAG: AzlC family ABC transporter permease [Salinarimonas sp.]|nr:AzlC family ABC transporter permease [Salinarimonas sp.]